MTWLADSSEAAVILPRVCRAYGLPEPIEYPRGSAGLLLAVGSGLMMATMDAVPELRWCIDIGGGRDYPRLPDAAVWFDRLVPLIVVHAWYSITAPYALRSALPCITHARLIVKSNLDLGTFQAETFHELQEAAMLASARRVE
jgi:hypothetical protein